METRETPRMVYSLEELQALNAGFRHLLAHGPEAPYHGICRALAGRIGMCPAGFHSTPMYGVAYDFMAMVLDLWPWALRGDDPQPLPTVCSPAKAYPVPGGDGWDERTPPGMFRWDALEFCAGVCSLMLASRENKALIHQHEALVGAEIVPELTA